MQTTDQVIDGQPAPVEQIGGPVAGGAFALKPARIRPMLSGWRVSIPHTPQPPLVIRVGTRAEAIETARRENLARGAAPEAWEIVL